MSESDDFDDDEEEDDDVDDLSDDEDLEFADNRRRTKWQKWDADQSQEEIINLLYIVGGKEGELFQMKKNHLKKILNRIVMKTLDVKPESHCSHEKWGVADQQVL